MIYLWEVIVYLILGIIEYFTINQLSSLGFIILFYIFPIIITIIFSSVKKGNLLTNNLLSSALALVDYIVLGNIFVNMGTWQSFAHRNSFKMADSEVQITQNMVDISQLVFVIVLYFGLGYLIYFVAKKMRNKG